MTSYLRLVLKRMENTGVFILALLSSISLLSLALYCEHWLISSHSEPQNFQARQHTLLYRLKPWCLTEETAYFGKSALNEIALNSYCACIVGKIDKHFQLDRFDPTADRRRNPYFTVQLQSFRQQCLDEIR